MTSSPEPAPAAGDGPPPPPVPPPPQPVPPPTPPPPPPARSLRRSTVDRKLAGVCGGAGRWLGVDPLIFRVGIVVLAIFGGAGVLVYGLAWLLLPEDGNEESDAQQLLRGRTTGSAVTAILVVLVGMTFFGGILGGGPDAGGLLLLAVLAGLVVLAVRQGRAAWPDRQVGGPAGPGSPPTPEAAGAWPASAPSTGYPPPATPAAGYPPPVTPSTGYPPAARPPAAHQSPHAASGYPPAFPAQVPQRLRRPRERSALGVLTLSLTLLVVGAIAAASLWSGGDVDVQVLLAAALAVVGTGLLVGAWAGRSRGLIGLGAVLTLLLVSVAAYDVPLRGGAGERTWSPASVADVDSPYRLAVGQGTLDLTGLDPDGELGVAASVAVGHLVVLVPDDVDLRVEAEVGLGQIDLPDSRSAGGAGVEREYAVDARPRPGSAEPDATVVLDLEVGMGQLEVRREAA